MASPFAFVPRKVAKSAKAQGSTGFGQHKFVTVPGNSGNSTGNAASTLPVDDEKGARSKKDIKKGKDAVPSSGYGEKPSYSDEDYIMLISLALSDHAVWSDPDLRRMLEWNSKRGSPIASKDGCTSSSIISAPRENLIVPTMKLFLSVTSFVIHRS